MRTHSWAGLLASAVAAGFLVHACTPGFQDDDDLVDEVRVEPSVIDFGQVILDVSNMETFKIYNDTAGVVTLETIRVEPDGGSFSIQGGPDDGYELPAGENKLVNVEYYASAEALHEAQVVVQTDHNDYPELTVDMVGCSMVDGCDDVTPGDDDDATGDDDDATEDPCGTIDVDPTSITFATVEIGQTDYQTINIENTGSAPLEITGLTVTGADFGHQGMTVPTEIPVGGGAQVQAKFTPTAAGALSGFLDIESCDSAQPTVHVALQGTGEEGCDPYCQPDIEVNPTDLDFGDISVNPGSVSFTITNSGVDPLTLNGITGTSSLAGGTVSVVSGDPNATLDPGVTEYYILQWQAGELFPGMGCLDFLDAASNYVTISSDDPDESSVYLSLNGCCDGTGQGMCQMVGLLDVMMCLSTCPDLVEGVLYCVVLGQSSC